MPVSNIRSAVLIVLLQVWISGCFSQSYNDLNDLGINCSSRNRCLGYRTNTERSCKCDFNCTAYQDCCIDALPKGNSRPPARTDVTCLKYGEDENTGVYVISRCSSTWNGPKEVRERCVGTDNLSDPLSAVPVTDVAQKETYRNLACAECNNANLAALKTFQVKIKCPGVEGIAEEENLANLTYNQERRLWGVNRLNSFGNGTEFFGCDIIFDVPGYLNSNIRFCCPNLISECATDWKLSAIAKLCPRYVSVVFSNTHNYRNLHCAICNHKSVDEVFCRNERLHRRKRAEGIRGALPPIGVNASVSTGFVPYLFEKMVDFNGEDGGNIVGKVYATLSPTIPACRSRQVYDRFHKRCRQIVCALPRHYVRNGRCEEWKNK